MNVPLTPLQVHVNSESLEASNSSNLSSISTSSRTPEDASFDNQIGESIIRVQSTNDGIYGIENLHFIFIRIIVLISNRILYYDERQFKDYL